MPLNRSDLRLVLIAANLRLFVGEQAVEIVAMFCGIRILILDGIFRDLGTRAVASSSETP